LIQGVAQASRLFSLYVPIHSLSSPFTIEKNSEQSNVQEGFGKIDDDNLSEINKISPSENLLNEKIDNSPIVNEKNILSDQTLLNENSSKNENSLKNEKLLDLDNTALKRKLDEGVFESFQHPKIKIGKMLLNEKKPKLEKKKHKFNII